MPLFSVHHAQTKKQKSDPTPAAQQPGFETLANHKSQTGSKKQTAPQLIPPTHKKHPLHSLCRGCLSLFSIQNALADAQNFT